MANAWRGNHPWAVVYDFLVERAGIGGALWRVGMGSDLGKLYAAAGAIGELAPGAAVLDVPCGGGVALRGVRPGQDVRYVAADIAPAMLARTRRAAAGRGVRIETVEADAGALPFADKSFDLAVCFTSLHCFPDPARAVKELARVLKPGARVTGSAFLTDTGLRYKPMLATGRLSGLIGPSGTHADLRRWLAWAGFDDVSLERSGGLTYFTGRRAG